MGKIFRYECRRLLWNKFFIGLAVVLLSYGAFVLHAVTILGVAHTAPFSPWSFGDYLSRMMPLLWIGMLFFLTFYTSLQARRTAILTDAAPMPPKQYALVRCTAALTGGVLLSLLCMAEAAVFYGRMFRWYSWGSLLLPALVTLLPALVFAPGERLAAGAAAILAGVYVDGSPISVGGLAVAGGAGAVERQLLHGPSPDPGRSGPGFRPSGSSPGRTAPAADRGHFAAADRFQSGGAARWKHHTPRCPAIRQIPDPRQRKSVDISPDVHAFSMLTAAAACADLRSASFLTPRRLPQPERTAAAAHSGRRRRCRIESLRRWGSTSSRTKSVAGWRRSSSGLSHCCTVPPSMTRVRMPSFRASAMSWVTEQDGDAALPVDPKDLLLQLAPGDLVHRAEGLVHQQDLRPRRQARAMPTRWRWPPERARGYRSARAGSSPTCRSRALTRSRRAGPLPPPPDGKWRAHRRCSSPPSCGGTGPRSGWRSRCGGAVPPGPSWPRPPPGQDPARIRRDEAVDQLQRRGLAAAGPADDGQELAGSTSREKFFKTGCPP